MIKTGMADRVREVFVARKEDWLSYQTVLERLGLAEQPGSADRRALRQALKHLVRYSYLVKQGTYARALYRFNGQGMRAPEHAVPNRVDAMTINRARVELRAELTPALAWGKRGASTPAETVEQFQARGGQVQRLTASWEQAA